MRIYPHWLEGTTRRNAIQLSGNPAWRLDEYAEYLLKLHAFFGSTIALSEIEVVDSPVLWRMFSNPEFKRFLHSEVGADYLELRCFTRDYRGTYENTEANEWNLATEGLKAALLHAHVATPEIRDQDKFLGRLTQMIAAGPDADFERLLHSWGQEPVSELDQSLMTGLTETVRFFSRRGAPTHRVESRGSYDQVLNRARDSSQLQGSERQHVERVIDLIEKRLPDPEARKRRTNARRLLDLNDPFERDAWVTINQGWSVSVQESVAVAGHMGHYGVGVDVGRYVQTASDSLIRLPETIDATSIPDPSVKRRLIPYTIDPGELSWSDLVTVMAETGLERQALQRAIGRRDDEATGETLRALARAASTSMLKVGDRPKALISPESSMFWLIGGFVISFGAGVAVGYEVAKDLLATQGALVSLDQGRVGVLNRVRKHAIATRIIDASAPALGIPGRG